MLPGLSLILLTFNEERNIAKTIQAAVNAGKKYAKKYEVVVLYYEGSTDNTLAVAKCLAAKNKNVRIVTQPENKQGYGIGLDMGIRAAQYEYVFYTDADNQFDLDEIGRLIPYTGRYDIVSGYRKKRRDPWGRVLSAKIYNIFLRVAFGLKIRDVDSAFKIYKRNIFDTFKIHSVHAFTDAEILLKAKNHGFSIREVAVTHYPRSEGSSNYGTGFVSFSFIKKGVKEILKLRGDLK